MSTNVESLVRRGGALEAPALVQCGLFLKALRPRQWTKNGALLAAVVFSGEFVNWTSVGKSLFGVLLFSLASGATYVLNDFRDLAADRAHPRKRFRPMASGRLDPRGASHAAFLLLIGTLAASFSLSAGFAAALATYVGTSLAYSLHFKHVAILDVMFIALGFVLRAVAGAAVVGVVPSPWLLVCTAFLSLFLAFGKRRKELSELRDEAGATRPCLMEYTPEMLDQIVTVLAGCTIMSYSMFTFLSGHSSFMMATIPFVFYGIFRYQLLLHRKGHGETPEKTLLEDTPLQITILLWLVTGAIIILCFA